MGVGVGCFQSPEPGGWYKVMGPGAQMGGQRPWRALELLPDSVFTEAVPGTRGREMNEVQSSPSRGPRSSRDIGRQTVATPCMGSSGAVGTESRKKLTLLEGEVEACTHELDR